MFLFVLLAASSSEQLHLVPFRGGIVAVLSAVLVWLASYGRSYILPDRFIAKRILAWIGARALPFYLVHIPAFLAAREIWFRLDPSALHAEPPHHVRFIATALVLAGACAELTHRLIEAPLQRIEPRIYPNPATATPNSPHAATSTEPAPLLADR
jgi:peptidoglycan/LPS O-acetylase OafA/YrhL